MNVLDENIIDSQRQALHDRRIAFRQIGVELGRAGMSDRQVVALLHGLNRPTFFTRDDQKVYLTARHGTVMTDSHDMEAHGNVVIYNDTYRLETEKMTYSHGSRVITSDDPVKIDGQAGDLTADSLRMDLNTNRLVMRGHVRGTLVSNQTP